jgi:hypothetical protein
MSDNSKIFGVSFRGWLAFIIVFTVCLMSLATMKVDEPLYTLCTVAVGFYFGSKQQSQSPTEKKDV